MTKDRKVDLNNNIYTPFIVCENECYYIFRDDNNSKIYDSSGLYVTSLSRRESLFLDVLMSELDVKVNNQDICWSLWSDDMNEIKVRSTVNCVRRKLDIINDGLSNKIVARNNGYAWSSEAAIVRSMLR